mgnify:CR=1 FL=1
MITILAIESSCDETSASVCRDGVILSNIIATQAVHEQYGGVVPELASRAHMQNIVPVVDEALKKAGVEQKELNAVAFTQAPGLIGSLLVGTQFAKSLSLALDIPLIAVHHMQAHVLANLIPEHRPSFPFLCLTVSGGHTQIVLVKNHLEMEVIGSTIDDAAGEAFDKAAKLLGFPYPGGPLVDKHAKNGDPKAFEFAKPRIAGYDYSFSGLKTSILYFLEKQQKTDANFIHDHLDDLCASIQSTIIDILFHKLIKAAADLGIKEIAIAGGVSANSGLRSELNRLALENRWTVHVPRFEYCTDNAAMIAITGRYMFEQGLFAEQSIAPVARMPI